MKKYKDFKEYVTDHPKRTQVLLKQLRAAIREAAPDAEEIISYGMPAFRMQGILAYFAGYANHIGFYPTASGIEAFKKDLSSYKCSKGTVHFPLDKPLPLALITKMVKFKVKDNLQKAMIKKK